MSSVLSPVFNIIYILKTNMINIYIYIKSLWMVTAAMKLKDACFLEGKL